MLFYRKLLSGLKCVSINEGWTALSVQPFKIQKKEVDFYGSFKALVDSGMFNVIDILLIGIIGILLYLMNVKQKNSEANVHHNIECMESLLAEERIQTEKLSHVVYEVKKEIEHERSKNYELREEILMLKAENERLRNIVADLERIVASLREENAKLLSKTDGE